MLNLKYALHYWLALLHTPTVGIATLLRLLDTFPNLESLFTASKQNLLEKGIAQELADYLLHPDWKAVERDLRWLDQGDNRHILTYHDKAYPLLLKETVGPPMVLFVQGDTAILKNLQIAMVGSRNPTPIGNESAFQFAKELSLSGLTVTSGLALGIDAACHRGTLAAEGLTIGVVGTGLDRVYPLRNKELATKILDQGGAIVSEFPPGTIAKAENFPRRNRIISGMSLGVLVIEAALQSGSLITARYANEQGREVFAIPGSIHNPLARGCHALLKQGAKLVETANDVLEELGTLFQANKIGTKSTKPDPLHLLSLDTKQAKLVECVGFEATPVDLLIERCGLPAQAISSMLVLLELQGYIKSVPGGYIKTQAERR